MSARIAQGCKRESKQGAVREYGQQASAFDWKQALNRRHEQLVEGPQRNHRRFAKGQQPVAPQARCPRFIGLEVVRGD